MNLKDYFDWKAVKEADPCWAGRASLEDAIEGCGDLGTLFCLWQTAQSRETGRPEDAFPDLRQAKLPGLIFSDAFAHSFCPDGFLKEGGKPDVPILFICRESNISGSIEDNILKPEGVGNDGQDKGNQSLFWLREVVECREKDPHGYFPDGGVLSAADKGAQTKYYNCLLKLLVHLKKENLIGKDVKLSDCAYLNINKRGGFADCDLTRLATYAQRYQLFIQKEISLIRPQHIVICGELNNHDLRETMESIFQTCGYQAYWVYPKHPSRYTNAALDAVKKRVRKEDSWHDAT